MDDLKLSGAIRAIAQKVDPKDGITKAQLKAIAADQATAPEVRVVAAQLATDDVYEAFTKVETEGLFNDDNITARDLYAAARGTSYDGKKTVDSPSLFSNVRKLVAADAAQKVQQQALDTSVKLAMVAGVTELRQYRNSLTGAMHHTFVDAHGMEHVLKGSTFKDKLEAFDALKIELAVTESNGVRKFARSPMKPAPDRVLDDAKPSPQVTDPNPPPNAPRR